MEKLEAQKYQKMFMPKTFTNFFAPQSKTFPLTILTSRQSFGEEELVLNMPRKYTVKCLKDGELYLMQKRDFFRKIYCNEELRRNIDAYLNITHEIRDIKLEKNKNLR